MGNLQTSLGNFVTVMVSNPIPDKDGHVYKVKRNRDGIYVCKDEGGNIDKRCGKDGICHHIEGMMFAWEKKKAVKRQFTSKDDRLLNAIKDYNLRTNTIITFYNPDVQQWMAEVLKLVYVCIAQNEGITRRDIPQILGVHYNSVTPSVLKLIRLGLIYEGDSDTSSGNPRARLYIDETKMTLE